MVSSLIAGLLFRFLNELIFIYYPDLYHSSNLLILGFLKKRKRWKSSSIEFPSI